MALEWEPVIVHSLDEVARLVAHGAQRVDIGRGDASWVVLADPEGNEFCILSPPE